MQKEPFYIHIHSSARQNSGIDARVLVQISSCQNGDVEPPREPEISGSDWTIPCLIEESRHENGHIELLYILKFHPKAIELAEKDARFSAQMHHIGRESLKEHFRRNQQVSNWSKWLSLENCIISQTSDTVILLWKLPAEDVQVANDEENFLPQTTSEICERKNENDYSFAKLSLSFSSSAKLHFYCRAEREKSFEESKVNVTERTLTWQLAKIPANTLRPWTHLNIGSTMDKLLLVTFPETRIIQGQAALQRSLDAGTRQQRRVNAKNRLTSTNSSRPMTLLYRIPRAALIDISNPDAEPLPLSVITDELLFENEALKESLSDGLSSSPEGSDPCTGSSTSAKDSLPSDEGEMIPSLPRSPFRQRSMSECDVPLKGILKLHRPIFRSVSESPEQEDGLDYSPSAPSAFDDSTNSLNGSDISGSRKSVRFAEQIQQHRYKANASILGQKKKNQRRDKCRKRRNSTGESSQGSESEGDPSSNSLPSTPVDGAPINFRHPKFFIETIHEGRLLLTTAPITAGPVETAAVTAIENEEPEPEFEENPEDSPVENKKEAVSKSKKKGKKGGRENQQIQKEKIVVAAKNGKIVPVEMKKTGKTDVNPKLIEKSTSDDSAIGDLESSPEKSTNGDCPQADDEGTEDEEDSSPDSGKNCDEWEEVVSRKKKLWRKKRLEVRQPLKKVSGRTLMMEGGKNSRDEWSKERSSTADSGLDNEEVFGFD